MRKILTLLVAALVFSTAALATEAGDRRAKDAPEFMAAIHELKTEAPAAYKLIMRKVEAGATIQEIRDYIYKPKTKK
tara:strand:- start:428 stop:658 length:231 start_codon:yes stop_codon:yes gene_type:complete